MIQAEDLLKRFKKGDTIKTNVRDHSLEVVSVHDDNERDLTDIIAIGNSWVYLLRSHFDGVIELRRFSEDVTVEDAIKMNRPKGILIANNIRLKLD